MEVPPKEKKANVEGGSMMGCALNDYLNLEENLLRNVQLLQRLLGWKEGPVVPDKFSPSIAQLYQEVDQEDSEVPLETGTA